MIIKGGCMRICMPYVLNHVSWALAKCRHSR